jgi:putative acetyltransferase
MILIRPEGPEHADGVRMVEEKAFGRSGEADLCANLQAAGGVLLSLVALDDGQVVGHVLFSPMTLESGEKRMELAGLGPVAVLPERQREGIGARLIRAGLEEIRQQGLPAVLVLGHPSYYPKFGFQPASRFGIRCSYPNVPDDAFMAQELRPSALEGWEGVARYRPEFDGV